MSTARPAGASHTLTSEGRRRKSVSRSSTHTSSREHDSCSSADVARRTLLKGRCLPRGRSDTTRRTRTHATRRTTHMQYNGVRNISAATTKRQRTCQHTATMAAGNVAVQSRRGRRTARSLARSPACFCTSVRASPRPCRRGTDTAASTPQQAHRRSTWVPKTVKIAFGETPGENPKPPRSDVRHCAAYASDANCCYCYCYCYCYGTGYTSFCTRRR